MHVPKVDIAARALETIPLNILLGRSTSGRSRGERSALQRMTDDGWTFATTKPTARAGRTQRSVASSSRAGGSVTIKRAPPLGDLATVTVPARPETI